MAYEILFNDWGIDLDISQEQNFNEMKFEPVWHKFASSKYDDPELATIKNEDAQKFMKALT